MKADYSRIRFNLKKGYTRVLQQQGRVTLDADWNEHVSIQADLDRKRLADVIGHCGARDDGFCISPNESDSPYDLNIEAGTIYVAGHRIHLDEPGTYMKQPFFPEPPSITAPEESSRTDLVYVCVRERHITYLEDETIREIALGGPDTTTRVQTIWQVHIEEGVNLQRCEENADAVMGKAGVGAGLLSVIEDRAGSEDDNPCATPVDSGYRGSENRLYRVEVHQSGTVASGASFKWSRYNGAIAFTVLDINVDNRTLTLARLGWDQIVTLKPNSWIELISEADELSGRPGAMLQISADAGAVNDAQRRVTLKDVSGIGDILNGYDPENDNVKVRLWDTDAVVLNEHFNAETDAYKIILENGISIEVRVANPVDLFRTGDYWTFTARAIQGIVEELTDEPPQGPERHFCKLALIHWNTDEGDAIKVEDCRPLFPALSEMLQLHYVGGDGQEGKPGDILQAPLMVRVSRGGHPVENVPVEFKMETSDSDNSDNYDPEADGNIFKTNESTGGKDIVVYTDDQGFAECQWQLESNRERYHQRVVAYIDAPDDGRRHQKVRFNANLSIAEEVSYKPPKDCINIDPKVSTVAEALDEICTIGAGGITYKPPQGCVNIESTTTNVAKALDDLCSIEADGITYNPPDNCPNLKGATNVAEALNKICYITGTAEAFHVVGVFWINDDEKKNAVHDQTVPLNQFIRGLCIECDAEPDPDTIKQASVFMTVELPFKTLPGVQMSYILEGNPDVEENNILWRPTDQAVQFLTKEIWNIVGAEREVLARLFLKGSKIHQRDNCDIHLDGNVVNHPKEHHNLMLPSGDGEEGGTFEMWFNLKIEEIGKLEGIYVVGVLHPQKIMGSGTTSNEGEQIVIENLSAINHRLDAFNLGYNHQHGAEDSGYTFADTPFNQDQALTKLIESGYQGGELKVFVLVQKDYETLAQRIINDWKSTFEKFQFRYYPITESPENIPNTILTVVSGVEVPDIVICDHHVINSLFQTPNVGEPNGVIRRPFYRRV